VGELAFAFVERLDESDLLAVGRGQGRDEPAAHRTHGVTRSFERAARGLGGELGRAHPQRPAAGRDGGVERRDVRRWYGDRLSPGLVEREAGVKVDPTAIDWLRLSATSTTPGRLGRTTYIQRINTAGGLAPAAADGAAATAGTTREVPHTPDYVFWKADDVDRRLRG